MMGWNHFYSRFACSIWDLTDSTLAMRIVDTFGVL
jgi:hypothetical protein